MADNPRSLSSSSASRSSATRTVRSQKIASASPTVDQRFQERDEAFERTPPSTSRSHTPGHLSSKSHGGSADHRPQTSDAISLRQRSQSVAANKAASFASPPPPQQPTPLPPLYTLRPHVDAARTPGPQVRPSSSSIGSNYSNYSNNKGDPESRRPVAMRSTSAIVSKANSTSLTSTSTAAAGGSSTTTATTTTTKIPPRKPSAPARPRGPYVPFPELQDPRTAPDVPAAPSSGMYWSRAPTSGVAHTPLRAHTTTPVGSSVFVFGGCDSRACFNELYVLDADSWHWSAPRVFGDVPVPLRAMTCTAISNKRLVVFGGGDGPAYYNDVYVLDTVNFRWHRPRIVAASSPSSGTGGGGGSGGGGTGGGGGVSVPSPRRAHTACFYRNGIYVFGGGDGVRALNDIWRLDVSDPHKMSWKLISGPSPSSSSSSPSGSGSGSPSDGRVPKARGYHTANMVGSKLIIYGGSDGGECFGDVWVYDVEARLWRSVQTPSAGGGPSYRRLSHTSTLVGSYLFVVGGHDGSEYSNDVLLLNLVTMTWDRRRVYGLPPTGRGYHGAVLHDSRLVVVGGFDGSEVFGDVWILELAVHAYYSQISHFTIEV
ncbi:hypothetical protein DL762_006695 [Monosporascus cannonballus]|uniref:Uncharacterized protein n=1 Tax=Monosporascus cannonballus TaxID=155416 RepID=A0ABY0H1A3_9PEZI|nr:hypothetical protein DL762_006695 [Monosporascus cannonballus]